MNTKERERLKVLARIDRHELTVADAAESLHISERQIYRIVARYRAESDAGLIHRLRGKPSNRRSDCAVREQVLRLYREHYRDYGPTLFAEMLTKYHHLTVQRTTLTRWLRASGVLTALRKKRPHRKRRERRSAIGALVQFDGSHHDWFEGRGEPCCLLVAIDDASNRVCMQFASGETTEAVLRFWWLYAERFGLPTAIYTDRYNVYYNDKKERLSEFGRAMKTLGVELIYAHSPQAKGRVERSNRTHQDRLVKALRREQISTIANANRFLEETYLAEHNTQFAFLEHLSDVHRSADGIDLKNILCYETIRHVQNDTTIRLNAQYLQLERSEAPLPPPRSKVTVREWLDGSVHLYWHENELAYRALAEKPISPRMSCHPPSTHPWRNKPLGKAKLLPAFSKIDSQHFVSSP